MRKHFSWVRRISVRIELAEAGGATQLISASEIRIASKLSKLDPLGSLAQLSARGGYPSESHYPPHLLNLTLRGLFY